MVKPPTPSTVADREGEAPVRSQAILATEQSVGIASGSSKADSTPSTLTTAKTWASRSFMVRSLWEELRLDGEQQRGNGMPGRGVESPRSGIGGGVQRLVTALVVAAILKEERRRQVELGSTSPHWVCRKSAMKEEAREAPRSLSSPCATTMARKKPETSLQKPDPFVEIMSGRGTMESTKRRSTGGARRRDAERGRWNSSSAARIAQTPRSAMTSVEAMRISSMAPTKFKTMAGSRGLRVVPDSPFPRLGTSSSSGNEKQRRSPVRESALAARKRELKMLFVVAPGMTAGQLVFCSWSEEEVREMGGGRLLLTNPSLTSKAEQVQALLGQMGRARVSAGLRETSRWVEKCYCNLGHKLGSEIMMVGPTFGLDVGHLDQQSRPRIGLKRASHGAQMSPLVGTLLYGVGLAAVGGPRCWEQLEHLMSYLPKRLDLEKKKDGFVGLEDRLKEEQFSDPYFVEFEKEIGESFDHGRETSHADREEAMEDRVVGVGFIRVVEHNWKKRKRTNRRNQSADYAGRKEEWVKLVNLEGKVGLKGERMLETRFFAFIITTYGRIIIVRVSSIRVVLGYLLGLFHF
ncbi:unnamed protein product [Linum trigynum]|uniref:Uncharacterized protein n=1 Tax=Linum trigynum TaxID=586398 RepID=A0AAV2CZJ0_9ROSI